MKTHNLLSLLATVFILSACGGGGGGSSAPVTPTAPVQVAPTPAPVVAKAKPIPVKLSSYENKTAASNAIGPQPRPDGAGNAIAFGDFFQDGTYSMVTHTLVYNNSLPYVAGSANATDYGSIHFWKSVNGTWVDKTPTLLSNTTGCLHARKAIVADFNGDGIPDIFFSCHGYDATPFPGESPHILLSQKDGTYKNVTLSNITCYCHSASAVDFNNNGYADIVATYNTGVSTPFFLKNNKDGSFTADFSRLPDSNAAFNTYNQPIFSAELIAFNANGKYDLWLGGDEPGGNQSGWTPAILPNDGNNSYVTTTPIMLPLAGPQYGLPLDIVFINGSIYLNLTPIGNDTLAIYDGVAIQKIDYPSMSSSIIYSHTGNFGTNLSGWIDWIVPFNGLIIAMNSTYTISIPQ